MAFEKSLDNFLNDKITDFNQIGDWIWKKDVTEWKNLDNLAWIALWITSPEKIREVSHGRILISETINYRTQKPERWWLFCQQIFGPMKNYECACGKYKRIKYKGVVCERCWVEVTKTSARRERMGHIDLYAPVAHIWFMKSVPSRIGLLLDLPVKKLEQIVYFASYIITDVYEEKRVDSLKELEDRFKVIKTEMQKEIQKEVNELKIKKESKQLTAKKFAESEAMAMKSLDDLDEEFEELRISLKWLKEGEVIWELEYRVLNEKFPHVFEWGTGAEYLQKLLSRIDLKKFIHNRQVELKSATQIKQKKLMQKIKLASNLLKSNQKPEWFILNALPILPPDLRPMIQLDGWRFASSDLNDLYRRVINRNNRLKKLIDLGAPDVILKNEKRMLQESVDMLITGETRSNKNWFVSANKKKLKSLTEILKGKQGRFRQNLLWKRVDYSARSVIVVGPNLKMDECGIPRKMALILFKPFIISKLIEDWVVYNIKHAEKIIEHSDKQVWDALDEVIEDKYVLMNRAPTLHRLSVQAFRPVLIDWKAIQLHPLTCWAFNADFDGDQMAVHLPLTPKAQAEARELMVTSKNLLAPSSWEPIVAPSQDMILWAYYVTAIRKGAKWEWQVFSSILDITQAYEAWAVEMKALIRVRINWKIIETNYGRLLFNEIVPEGLWFINVTLKKKALQKILAESFEKLGSETTAHFVDKIKDFWYKYSTISGLSISKNDMLTPENKDGLLEIAEEKIKVIGKKTWAWFLTSEEKTTQSVRVWAWVKKEIEAEMKVLFPDENHIFNMIDSGARWNIWNLTQLCGMKWLVASASWDTIELPIKSNLKEWFSTLEYFIATHGWRKGKADTALKTAQSGYLTRRLVDASQNIIVKDDDCKTVHSKIVNRKQEQWVFNESFEDRLFSHTIAITKKDDKGNTIIEEWTVIDKKVLEIINANKIDDLSIRSVLTCESEGWVCKKCYGLDLGLSCNVEIGTPVWVIAAQSIWEPGTQLTMRTFHSGWVAQEWWDMTQGLARVEELFEARIPKLEAEIVDIDWVIQIDNLDDKIVVKITSRQIKKEEYYYSSKFEVAVKVWNCVKAKQIIARNKAEKQRLTTKFPWIVRKIENWVIIIEDEIPRSYEYSFELGKTLLVTDGQEVKAWEKLTSWALNISKLMEVAWVTIAEQYIVDEIKSIYSSQGQTVNSKHIELVVRQMFSKVRILDKWDSEFFPGDIIDIITYKKTADELIRDGKKAPFGERLLLWITKISLYTESWLSAASFQETVRVLVEGSVSAKIDKLKELKENVIIGRLIPAWKQYRKLVWREIESDNISEEYFNAEDLEEDISVRKLEELNAKHEHESDF